MWIIGRKVLLCYLEWETVPSTFRALLDLNPESVKSKLLEPSALMEQPGPERTPGEPWCQQGMTS